MEKSTEESIESLIRSFKTVEIDLDQLISRGSINNPYITDNLLLILNRIGIEKVTNPLFK